MSFVMVTTKWPLSSSEACAKVYIEKILTRPTPDWVKRNEVYLAAGADDGLKGYNLVECEDEHLAEGLRLLAEGLAEYRVVPGYSYNIETLASPEFALEALGMKM